MNSPQQTHEVRLRGLVRRGRSATPPDGHLDPPAAYGSASARSIRERSKSRRRGYNVTLPASADTDSFRILHLRRIRDAVSSQFSGGMHPPA